jgi:hydrogenase nickel incorporation protein HypB
MAEQSQPWVVEVEKPLLGHNAKFAEQNRAAFQRAGVLVLNVVSAPGSGKTALLERTLADLRDRLRIAVQVGDLQTDNDARRLSGRGAPVVQIVTGGVCHLEASMVARALEKFDLALLDLLIIENVGNLVCTASYDLGEARRVVLLSVTEGEDKPLKYPTIFRGADVVLVTKMDIADAVGVNLAELRGNIARVAPRATMIEVSALTGVGLEQWYEYLLTAREKQKTAAINSAAR